MSFWPNMRRVNYIMCECEWTLDAGSVIHHNFGNHFNWKSHVRRPLAGPSLPAHYGRHYTATERHDFD